MSDFFEIFNPGMRHWREQRDLDKTFVLEQKKGGSGPRPLDLDAGEVTVIMPVSARSGAERPTGTPPNA